MLIFQVTIVVSANLGSHWFYSRFHFWLFFSRLRKGISMLNRCWSYSATIILYSFMDFFKTLDIKFELQIERIKLSSLPWVMKDLTEFCNNDLLSAVINASVCIALSQFTTAAGLPLQGPSLRSVNPFSLRLPLTLLTHLFTVLILSVPFP